MPEVVVGHPWFDKLTMTNCHPEPVEGWIPALRTAGMTPFGIYFRVNMTDEEPKILGGLLRKLP